MYFVDRYSPDGPPSPQDAEEAVEWSGRSSLDAVAWGLAYTDLGHIVLPPVWGRFVNRGDALERRWGEFWEAPARPGPPTLEDWRPGVEQGWRPVQAFNATAVETGQRFLMSPMDWDPPGRGANSGADPETVPATGFRQDCPGRTMAVPTAARLSASFPYVTPVARPYYEGKPPGRALHLADGGYYDNFGVLTAVDFLDDMLQAVVEEGKEAKSPPREVVLVRTSLRGPGESAGAYPATDSRSGSGWLMSALGPALTVANVRGDAQATVADSLAGYLQRTWNEGISFTTIEFVATGETPLSWHLSEDQKRALDESWDSRENQASLEGLRAVYRRLDLKRK